MTTSCKFAYSFAYSFLDDSFKGSRSFFNLFVRKSSTSFKEPTKEEISEASGPRIEEFINDIIQRLYDEKVFPKVIAFVNTMRKQKKNSRAILHTLNRCYLNKPENPWAYCVKIMKQEDGSYNAREYEKTHPKES